MAEVYEAVCDRILVNLAKYFPYIHKSDEVKDLFEYQARMLAQMGRVNRESVAIITQSLKGEAKAIEDALTAAIVDALKDADPKLRQAAERGLLGVPASAVPELAPNQLNAFRLYYQQSIDKMNLVNTVMLESTQAIYQRTVADAVARLQWTQSILNTEAGTVVTGVSTWNEAMHDAVAQMIHTGITGFVDHGGHRWSPEAYVAMDIRTTMFNCAREATWERNQQYGNDLYQVSSHNGARPLCYPWQGKILSTSGRTGTTQDIDGNTVEIHSESEVESFRWGGGLFGVNCRHYPMPFIPGFSALRGEPQDENENTRMYALTQKQRSMERELRAHKLDLATAQAQGAPASEIEALKDAINRKDGELADFCDDNGLPRRKSREYTPINATWPDT
jgi:hypothetical protein